MGQEYNVRTLRMKAEDYNRVKASAEKNLRSVNAEIVSIIREHYAYENNCNAKK